MPPRLAPAAILAGTMSLLGCGRETGGQVTMFDVPTLDHVTQEQWRSLAARRLFFGHQSVGGNVMEGVRDVLTSNPQISLRVIETADPLHMKEPGLYHAVIGRNGAPDSKLLAFTKIVTEGIADSGTAMLKYCYVDITRHTDPDAFFKSYRGAIDSLRAAHPTLTIVHMTLPLRADRGTWHHVKTIVRGNIPERELNLTRQRYNEMLRVTYGGREPVFDLAFFESRRPDGGAASVRYQGQEVPVLAREWTNDGGHLNPRGRRRIAEAFLATLASQ